MAFDSNLSYQYCVLFLFLIVKTGKCLLSNSETKRKKKAAFLAYNEFLFQEKENCFSNTKHFAVFGADVIMKFIKWFLQFRGGVYPLNDTPWSDKIIVNTHN